MLGTWLFVAFWVLLGVGVFFLAIRGSGRRSGAGMYPPSVAARRATGTLLTLVYVGFGIALPLLFLIGNHTNASAQVGGYKLDASEKSGRQLFGHYCGLCHTLAAASAVGKVGPDLDTLQPTPSEALVLHTIRYGCLQNPPSNEPQENCLGQGNMPQGIIQGQQAIDVAKFVARVAGRE
jgi:mono/diheme cytochrome c family protein